MLLNLGTSDFLLLASHISLVQPHLVVVATSAVVDIEVLVQAIVTDIETIIETRVAMKKEEMRKTSLQNHPMMSQAAIEETTSRKVL